MSTLEVGTLIYDSIESSGGSASTIPILKIRMGPNGTNMTDGGTTWTYKNVFDSAEINVGNWSFDTNAVTVPENGLYYLYCNMGYFEDTSGDTSYRWTVLHRFVINGNAQYESARSTYCRDVSGHHTASTSLTTLYSLNAGDQIRLQFYHATGYNGNDCTLLDMSHFLIYKIAEQ